MAMTLVETVTVGSGGAASIEFTNIPQTGKDLLVLSSVRSSGAGSPKFYFNNDTTDANYSRRVLSGTGSGTSSFSQNLPIFALSNDSSYTASTFSNSLTYISNYTSSVAKSISTDAVMENNATATLMQIVAGSWSGTAAITELDITTTSGTHAQFSTFSLYIIS